MDLSIIIPSYNTQALLKRSLDSIVTSLKDSKLQYEIIVVDNASTDGSVELVRKYQQAKLIVNKENVGYGRANNQGIKKAQGEYVVLLNSDIEVLNHAVTRLLEFARENTQSFAGGKLYNEDHSPQTSCGPFFSLPVVALSLFLQGDRLGVTRWSPEVVKQVDWVSGACLISRKTNFVKVGLFDEAIFMYMDEVDLLYRAQKLGYTAVFCPQARFIHRGAASSASHKEPVVNIYRGLNYFYKKHRSIMERKALSGLLRLKAVIAIIVGKLTADRKLVETYAKALSIS